MRCEPLVAASWYVGRLSIYVWSHWGPFSPVPLLGVYLSNASRWHSLQQPELGQKEPSERSACSADVCDDIVIY